MGVAAYNRGSKVISTRLEDDHPTRPVEFEMMDRLNALGKYEDAGTPFDTILFSFSHNGWWAVCPITGFGYWYKTIYEAVKRWNVQIVGLRGRDWVAIPTPRNENQS